jgi:two-component system phosphate regulon response regulator PhoB
MGADDYIPKPFSPKILIARIKAALRRNAEVQDNGSKNIVKRGPLVLNKGKREASLAGKPLVLTFSEFEILYFLARRPGWVYTRNQIVNAVKGDDYPVTERSIDVQVVGLRKKLGDAGELIETVRGVGYRFIETY